MITTRQIILIWLCLLGLAIAGSLIALPNISQAEKTGLILGLIAASASLVAVPFFFFGLRHFEHRARRAFALVCAGMVLYGMGTVQFPIVNLVEGGNFWVSSGIALLPFVLAVSLQYFGIWHFGRLMLIKSRLLIWPLVYVSAFVVAFVVPLIPGANPLMIAQSWLLTIISFTILATAAIRSRIATRYKPALTWLLIGNAMVAFSAVHQVGITLIHLPDSHWYMAAGLSAWPFAAAALAMARAGYEFTRIEVNLSSGESKNATQIEVVLYAASLVSDPRAVDKSLDRLRRITSSSDPNSPLNERQEAELAETYKEIEAYLVNNDPVLRFSVSNLRESIRARFDIQDTSDSSFWRLLRS